MGVCYIRTKCSADLPRSPPFPSVPPSSFKIAVQFWYEWFDEAGQWWRTYGLENWTYADNGLMRKRQMSGNDVKITDEERWFKDGVDVNTVEIGDKHF